jgi:phage terminase large subunit-like protein
MARKPDPTTAYAQAVVDGAEPAGPHVLGACKRHLRDLGRDDWVFDTERAGRVLRFFPGVLRLAGGEHEGRPFELLAWQAFIVGSLFGWVGADGMRRFRTAYIETAKGSGKSPLAAGVGHYMLSYDDEHRAIVFSAASKKDQAAILFRDAVAMYQQSPLLGKKLTPTGGKGKEWNLANKTNGGFFRYIASEGGLSGDRPHCALLDEIHEHPNDEVVKMMRAGTKGRRQALIFMITNSGANRACVCWFYHEYAVKIAAGLLEDDAFFSYVCALDDGDDPLKDESCWPKANPSLGQTIQPRYLRELVTQARGMPSSEAVVRRLNFCEWTDAETPWIDRDLWEACEVPSDEDPTLSELPCFLGLDLSRKRDLTSAAACWQHPDGSLTLHVYFWTPLDTLDDRAREDSVPYRTWLNQGHLFAEPGRLIDNGRVVTWLQGFLARNDVRLLAFDQALLDDFLAACDHHGLDAWIDDRERDDDDKPIGSAGTGLRMVRHGQGFAGYMSKKTLWMPRSISEFERVVINRTIRIRVNPVLNWNSASAVVVGDPSGNRKWDKRKATGRIDGIVAAAMAIGAATVPQPAGGKSFWENP